MIYAALGPILYRISVDAEEDRLQDGRIAVDLLQHLLHTCFEGRACLGRVTVGVGRRAAAEVVGDEIVVEEVVVAMDLSVDLVGHRAIERVGMSGLDGVGKRAVERLT